MRDFSVMRLMRPSHSLTMASAITLASVGENARTVSTTMLV